MSTSGLPDTPLNVDPDREIRLRIGGGKRIRTTLNILYSALSTRVVFETAICQDLLGYYPKILFPETMNEWILYQKVTASLEKFAFLADKWAVRSYVAERIGEKYLKTVYDVVDDIADFRFAKLPSRFAAKATHGCGANLFVQDDLDPTAMTRRLASWLKSCYGQNTFEFWYMHIPPRILIEEYLCEADGSIPTDLKVFVINETAQYIQVVHGRFTERKSQRIYTRDWEPLDVVYVDECGPIIRRPDCLSELLHAAEALAAGLHFARIDFHHMNDDRLYFGEITPAPNAGRVPFRPTSFDIEAGQHFL